MTPERAIEILTALVDNLERKDAPELVQAIKLGVKALERQQIK